MRCLFLAFSMTILAGGAEAADAAADAAAGAELAEQCAGCHGADGVSVEETIPNLAAQKAGYIAAQLRAFRTGDRKNELMNAIAAQLEDAEMESLAAHFAGLPGAAPGAAGAPSETLAGTRLTFPESFPNGFRQYHTISFEDRKQVRNYYADAATLEALAKDGAAPEGAYLVVEIFKAKTDDAGAPIRGDDGQFVAGDPAGYTAMQKIEGAGAEVPEILRNGDWRYATFSTDRAVRAGLNEGRCLACHKPLSGDDYLFTLDIMKKAAGGG
jgi:cytochrome c553